MLIKVFYRALSPCVLILFVLQTSYANESNFESSDPYEVLGVSKDSDRDEVMSQYRSLIKSVHPDVGMHAEGVTPMDPALASIRIAQITAAKNQILMEISGASEFIRHYDERRSAVSDRIAVAIENGSIVSEFDSFAEVFAELQEREENEEGLRPDIYINQLRRLAKEAWFSGRLTGYPHSYHEMEANVGMPRYKSKIVSDYRISDVQRYLVFLSSKSEMKDEVQEAFRRSPLEAFELTRQKGLEFLIQVFGAKAEFFEQTVDQIDRADVFDEFTSLFVGAGRAPLNLSDFETHPISRDEYDVTWEGREQHKVAELAGIASALDYLVLIQNYVTHTDYYMWNESANKVYNLLGDQSQYDYLVKELQAKVEYLATDPLRTDLPSRRWDRVDFTQWTNNFESPRLTSRAGADGFYDSLRSLSLYLMDEVLDEGYWHQTTPLSLPNLSSSQPILQCKDLLSR